MVETADVLVAGGGIAGLAFALALRRAAPGARVVVADPGLATERERSRSLRAVAVAAGSRRFLEGLGAWSEVAPMAQPIVEMAIADGRDDDTPRPVFLEFDGEAEPGEPFAHMVFADDLRASLRTCAEAAGVEILPSAVSGFAPAEAALRIDIDAAPMRARLLVAADGGRSRLRDAAGIGTVGWDYDQAGVVATLSHDIAHDGRAVQHFLPAGPLALLPLRARDGTERRSSLVWSTSAGEAQRLVALDPEAFVAVLEGTIGFAYGALSLEDRASAQALRLALPRRLAARRFVLMGDAARTIHPLAGQGLNLGLRDAAALVEILAPLFELGLDPGDPDALLRYERARRFDSVVMAAVTDGLNRLFSNDSLPVRLARDLGLGLVDRAPALKRLFIRDASGLLGSPPGRFKR